MILRDERTAAARWLDRLDEAPDGGWARLLAPIGRGYEGLGRLKRRLQPDIPLGAEPATIGVGNLRVGGTGKTPIVLELGRLLVESGRRVEVASRGYRSEGGGDEPGLMRAAGLKVHLGADRRRAHRRARENGAEILLLDDALQTRYRPGHCLALVLERDLTRMPRVLPAGPAREGPVGLERADALVVRREGEGATIAADWRGLPMVGVRLSPRAWIDAASGEASGPTAGGDDSAFPTPAVALSGLARPSSFESDIARLGIELVGAWRAEDHWNPSASEVAEIESWALGIGAKTLLCPEKNLDRLRPQIDRLPLFALSSSIRWECDDPLGATGIRRYLESVSGA